MGQLIVSAQMTADSVMDHMEDWLDPELESEQDGVEQLRAADALILGLRPTKASPLTGRTRRARTPSSSTRSRNTLPHTRSRSRSPGTRNSSEPTRPMRWPL